MGERLSRWEEGVMGISTVFYGGKGGGGEVTGDTTTLKRRCPETT
jgi:hypothetical protein